jgi:2-polyprenyl-6-methoxyphenol hydroxylase-like FAD-dependent oxidoreductase
MSGNQTQSSVSTQAPRAIIIGGSLGGLFSANLLRCAGWQVDIYERSPHDLDSRGGGIVLQPQVVEAFRRSGLDVSQLDLGVGSEYRLVLRPDGTMQSKQHAPQTQTSWSLIYSTLRNAFGDEHYHQGHALAAIEQPTAGRVIARFDNGHIAEADLLVGADGGNSTVRRLTWPAQIPSYAGYVAWRGLVPETAVPDASQVLLGNFGFANNRHSHILGYLVPGERNDTRPGKRFYNWVWYRVASQHELRSIMTDAQGRDRGFSVPEGLLAASWHQQVMREAAELLPPAFRDVVHATEAPFVQAIRDLAVDSMVDGRVILLGDAAAIPRPHTAASTSKAASNALALADALRASPTRIDEALASWEITQVALGKRLREYGEEIGNHLMFRSIPAHSSN